MNFQDSYNFLFEETYRMWKSDLLKIFRIGTRGSNGGCNLSSCILVLIGIESFARCFTPRKDHAKAVNAFVNAYYPELYHDKMEKIHQLFRHGLAHNYFPKSELRYSNASRISFGVDLKGRVIPLSRIKKDINEIRSKVLNLSPKHGKPYVVVPQILFLDTVRVMESLKKKVKNDKMLQEAFISNCNKVRKSLGHVK